MAGSFSTLDPASRLTASYGGGPAVPDGGASETGAFVTATTIVGGSTFDVNAFVGADRYYGHTTPITGQNTITTNLEAGHFWNGHETLQHVATTATNFVAGTESWGGVSISAKYDAHATWAAMLIGGRQTAVEPEIRQLGIAPGTSLRSAAIASEWLGAAYATGFELTLESFLIPYQATFGVADVVNSSWGFGDDSPGVAPLTVLMDAYAYQSPGTTYVVSAGNSGPNADTVVSPGSGYNAITVAALGGANGFTTAAGFSSRGPTDFGYLSGGGGPAVVVADVRAAVDIAAPGTSLVSAFYGGQTGGNNATLSGSLNFGSIPDAYSDGIQGTSFSAPIVAGGAALVASAAKTLASLSSNPDATQSVVVKALLLTGADKTAGWTNGQQQVTVGPDTFIRTTRSLDWDTGAGRMNLDTTFDLQVNGQTDLAGKLTGSLGTVVKTGWDFGNALVGVANDYVISDWLRGGTTFTASLAWMRSRFFDFDLLEYADVAQADLNLSVWELDESNQFTTLVARSESLYNTVEHLSFALPQSGFYGLRVEYPLNTFDNTVDDVWGNVANPQDYGLSWQAVPEPGSLMLAAAATGLWPLVRRSRSTRRS
jgi:subtilisin family serine protease